MVFGVLIGGGIRTGQFGPAYTGARHSGENQKTGVLRALQRMYDGRWFSVFSSAAAVIFFRPVWINCGWPQERENMGKWSASFPDKAFV